MTKLLGTAALVRALSCLLILFAAPSPAQGPVSTLTPPQAPPPLAGSMDIHLYDADGVPHVVDTIVVSSETPGDVASFSTTTFGDGSLHDLGGHPPRYGLVLDEGGLFEVTWDPALHAYAFDLGIGYIQEPYLPGEKENWGPFCWGVYDHPNGYGFRAEPGGFPMQISFWQFVSITVEFLDVDPLTGLPVTVGAGDASSPLIPTTGNGGLNASPAPAWGNGPGPGMIRGDGSTVYVDSGTLGTPGYVESGGSGDVTGAAPHMEDGPLTNWGPGLAANYPNPTGRPFSFIKVRADFTTYLMIDGQPFWKWKWFVEALYSANGDLLGINKGLEGGEPILGMEPRHEQAAAGFSNGSAAGVPN